MIILDRTLISHPLRKQLMCLAIIKIYDIYHENLNNAFNFRWKSQLDQSYPTAVVPNYTKTVALNSFDFGPEILIKMNIENGLLISSKIAYVQIIFIPF